MAISQERQAPPLASHVRPLTAASLAERHHAARRDYALGRAADARDQATAAHMDGQTEIARAHERVADVFTEAANIAEWLRQRPINPLAT